MTHIMVGTIDGDWYEAELESPEVQAKLAANMIRSAPELDGQYDDNIPTYLDYEEGASMSTTETKVRHSPTPWDSKGTALYSNNLSIGIVDIREDAELIVRAVNSHADMLEALEAIVNKWTVGDLPLALIQQARAAIKKAKG